MDIKAPSSDEDGPGAEYFAADDVIRRRVKAMQLLLYFLAPLALGTAGLMLWALVFFAFQIRSWSDAGLYVVGLLAGGMAAFGCVWPLYKLWDAGRTTLKALPLFQHRGIVLTEGYLEIFTPLLQENEMFHYLDKGQIVARVPWNDITDFVIGHVPQRGRQPRAYMIEAGDALSAKVDGGIAVDTIYFEKQEEELLRALARRLPVTIIMRIPAEF